MKIKNAIFQVFREEKLPTINTDATPSEINKWKSSLNLQNVTKTSPSISEDSSITYILRIVEKVFSEPSEKASDTLVTYTMSVCDVFLKNINNVFNKYLVSFATLRK